MESRPCQDQTGVLMICETIDPLQETQIMETPLFQGFAERRLAFRRDSPVPQVTGRKATG
jgi:hypothetical protein